MTPEYFVHANISSKTEESKCVKNKGQTFHAIVSLRCSIFSKLHLRHTVQPYTTIMNSKTTRQRYNTFWQHKLFNWIILFIPEIIHKSTDHAGMMLSLFTGSTWKEQKHVSLHANIFFYKGDSLTCLDPICLR